MDCWPSIFFSSAFPSVDNGITIYSFRHSGAIEIFKRTGSLTKLQKAMGHSSLNVSLTYLRGLEVTELKEEDMPNLDKFPKLACWLPLKQMKC